MRSISDNTITDLEYDLVTTLSNLMQGREVLSKYAKDAEAAGDMDCAEIFRTLQSSNEDAAGRCRNALARILNQ
ncbi:MAG: hypothetical protein IT336_09300 [Thermomicrobiales bacterium]|nr:hypothetical protein [Thermomicrobiales bacterium]